MPIRRDWSPEDSSLYKRNDSYHQLGSFLLHPVLRRPVFSIITFAGFIELGPVLHPVRHDLDLILGLSFGIGPTVLLETSQGSFRMDSVRSLFSFFIGNNAIFKDIRSDMLYEAMSLLEQRGP